MSRIRATALLEHRVQLPVGPLFCVIDGVTRGRAWAATAARAELRQLASETAVRRRFAPHQLRHAHAVELAREGVAVNIIQRQLGHVDLGGHVDLPARHPSQRGHRRGPLQTPAEDLRRRRASGSNETPAGVVQERTWRTGPTDRWLPHQPYELE